MLIHHITLIERGTVVTHRLDTLDPLAVDACRALLPNGGPIPGFAPYRVEIVRPVFSILRGQEPIVSCGIGRGADPLWYDLWEMQAQFFTCEQTNPPNNLWLAVVMLPAARTTNQRDLLWMTHFERCMAAAMV